MDAPGRQRRAAGVDGSCGIGRRTGVLRAWCAGLLCALRAGLLRARCVRCARAAACVTCKPAVRSLRHRRRFRSRTPGPAKVGADTALMEILAAWRRGCASCRLSF